MQLTQGRLKHQEAGEGVSREDFRENTGDNRAFKEVEKVELG